VDNSLVVGLDQSGLVQDCDLSFEVKHRLRLRVFVNQNHAFSEHVTFECLFLNLRLNGEADSLASKGLFNIHSLMVDATHFHRLELSRLIRS